MALETVSVLRKLGKGGQANVYLARREDGRLVAFKCPLDPDNLPALRREAARAASLVHPNVVRVLGLGVDASGHEGILLEYVEGLDLGRYLDARGCPLFAGELWPLISGIAAGIDHSHECNLLHFDLKPGNILLRAADWTPKVADFGLSKRLEGSEALSAHWAGTPYYIAPEVWRLRQPVTTDAERFRLRRSDIYSFAVLIYKCLTGALPLDFPTTPPVRDEVWRRQIDQVTQAGQLIPHHAIPGPAWQVLRLALSTEYDRRPESAHLLVERLREAWTHPDFAILHSRRTELDAATGRAKHILHPKDQSPMVLIPGQRFTLGDDARGRDDNCPEHACDVRGFYIDLHPVTNAQFARFVRAKSPTLGGNWESHYKPGENDDHPVRGVLYADAEKYCASFGKRLPTEIEWECEAKAGDNRPYPWGTRFEPGMAHAQADPTAAPPAGPVRVGSYAPHGYGLFDMAGNVAELVQGWYCKDFYRDRSSPGGPESGKPFKDRGTARLVRGGCWSDREDGLATFSRGKTAPGVASEQVGFRAAWDPA